MLKIEGRQYLLEPIIEFPDAESLINEALDWHDKFDIYWQHFGRHSFSFHNRFHIQAVKESAEKLIGTAGRGNDPLNLINDLERWNEKNRIGQTSISFDEFHEAVNIAISFHDTGNIIKNIKTTNIYRSKFGQINYLPIYTAAGAEERSQRLAEKMINKSKLPKEKKDKYIPLINYLIGETKYEGDLDKPFARFMRVVDQIGNNLFNSQVDRVFGLLEEMSSENEKALFNPDSFFNFVRERFPQLVDDVEKRNAILAVWNKKLPDPKVNMTVEMVEIKPWLSNNQPVIS